MAGKLREKLRNRRHTATKRVIILIQKSSKLEFGGVPLLRVSLESLQLLCGVSEAGKLSAG